MLKKTMYIIFALIILVVALFFVTSQDKKYNGIEVTAYKSLSCGCCGNYFPFLKQKGFEVNVVSVNDISKIKEEYGVPEGMESCHTVIIEGYFVEGHVPMEAIDKLLEERPDIDGITLPNMPAGSPGMMGQKKGDFVIFQITDGKNSEFMRV